MSSYSKKDRAGRRAKCVEFLRRAGSMPDAMALAKLEGWSADTSVWLGALGDMFAALQDAKPKRKKGAKS